MKTVKTPEGVIRVSDAKALEIVEQKGCSYCPKQEFKRLRSGPPPAQKRRNPELVPLKKKKPSKPRKAD